MVESTVATRMAPMRPSRILMSRESGEKSGEVPETHQVAYMRPGSE